MHHQQILHKITYRATHEALRHTKDWRCIHYKHQCLTLVHDAINGNSPEIVGTFVKLTATKNSYSLRAKEQNPLDIQKPNLKSRQGQSSFRLKGPALWNELPNELREIEKRNIFKKRLKVHLMANYLATVSCTNHLCTDRRHHGW